jgi:fused signal recognition particle receptor
VIFWRKDKSETPPAEPASENKSWFSRLAGGLSKSSARLGQGIADLVTKRRLDQDMLDGLEDLLITADLGPKTAQRIVEEFGKDRFGKDISEDEVKDALANGIAAILQPVARPMNFERPADGGPLVVLVCGVNGVGKTTTIGKIAYDLQKNQGKRVMLAAGDTFRAAAVEQLEIWAQRAGGEFVKKDLGADAAAVAYEACEKARAADADILFIDTAGRLHNKSNLMAELEKIVRVLKKQDETMPHAVLVVLDATTGQNAFEQVRVFREMVNVTGLAVTKLDGSAKGGVVVGLAGQFGLPIHFIGVGEGAEDLQPFDAADFARSLLGNIHEA